jgi:hypothetical protein
MVHHVGLLFNEPPTGGAGLPFIQSSDDQDLFPFYTWMVEKQEISDEVTQEVYACRNASGRGAFHSF